ncbi:inner centromere protein-like isoform X1 [Ammospiza caudacuta]|uniref:inner centromere protein-like isoform X1 n=1 Tax=Ammospiza caudacuta TaxID=2857398 RepID=UPI0027383270|nr:inner centromere protein-like isoform X1 [Ammospiza caudacuta]XP_058663529.1 inner centromere protein-like isoform X1 [Ammospiza caudacuta]
MAEGPQQLLQVCGQRLSRFLSGAQHKRLAWLREVEEQGMRMLKSSFRDEPMLLPKTPSQRRRLRKRQSSWMREENKELSRRRLSRRRSGVKLQSSSLNSQQCQSQEQPQSPGCEGQDVSVPGRAPGSQAGITPQLPALPRKQPEESRVPMADLDGQECPHAAAGGDAAPPAVLGEQLPEVDAAAELQDIPGVTGIAAEQPGRDGEQGPRRASTSTPKAAQNGDPAALQGDGSPQGLEALLFQDSPSKSAAQKSRTRRRSGLGAPRKSHRASLAEKCSLASRRENIIRRAVSRARKAAARESSSASSRVSCQSSLEAFVEEDVTSSTRPELEPNSPREKAPGDVLVPSTSPRAASPSAQHLSPLEQQAGNAAGSHVNPRSEPQKSQEQPHCAKPLESSSRMWMKGCKQALGVLWHGQQTGGRVLSPLDEKHKTLANQAPASPSPSSKAVRPLKNFLQGQGGGIKDLIKRNTPTRSHLKGDFVEKERQRLENLRKKQEAEEQRKKKVEEEKRQRQAEMKQKREERLRKALQARERAEQMEEKKKKRVEQKILQSDEKLHTSQVREEKVAEERSKRKGSKKHGEAEARKQKSLRGDENEQQEPLQKRREDEVKERGKTVLELKNLLEQKQLGQAKERYPKQRGKEKPPQAEQEPAALAGKATKGKESSKKLPLWPGLEKRYEPPESFFSALNVWLQAEREADGQQQPREEKKPIPPAAPGTWPNKAVKKSLSTSCLGSLEAAEVPASPPANENSYGLDLNSDDSTDDESNPRKPIPAWADGAQLQQAIVHQYYHPVDLEALFGTIPSPKLEDIFYKNKPRYFKRTSSAVWHSPPGPSCSFQS